MHVGAGEPSYLSLSAASRALQSFFSHQPLQNSTGDRHNLQCEGFPLDFHEEFFLIPVLGSSITAFCKTPESLQEVQSCCPFFEFAGRLFLMW